MSLDELEASWRQSQQRKNSPTVIVAMQIPEEDIRFLRPRLERRGESLSEHVRKLIRQNVTWQS